MIASHDVGVDIGGDDIFFEFGADEEVVDSPADVSLSGSTAHAPPRVAIFFFSMCDAEGVEVAFGDDLVDPLSFDFEEAGNLFVFLRSGEVDGCVGCVYVAAKDDGFFFAELFDELEEGFVKVEFVLESFFTGFAIGEVDIEEMEVLKLGMEDASFAVEDCCGKFGFSFEGLDLRVGGGAGVAGADGGTPKALITVG